VRFFFVAQSKVKGGEQKASVESFFVAGSFFVLKVLWYVE
jgi:hypothetical protein